MKRVTTARLIKDFIRGVSFVGLARKYGMTYLEAQDRIRQWSIKHKRRGF